MCVRLPNQHARTHARDALTMYIIHGEKSLNGAIQLSV